MCILSEAKRVFPLRDVLAGLLTRPTRKTDFPDVRTIEKSGVPENRDIQIMGFLEARKYRFSVCPESPDSARFLILQLHHSLFGQLFSML